MRAQNPVITATQAKQITRGRTPLVPVEYEEALKALEACTTLDESKYWSDKADALAAWAKIYRSKDAEIKAKKLKLHAYRRMSDLAQKLRPQGRKKGFGGGMTPGPGSLLMEHGFNKSQTQAIRRIGAIPEKKFSEIVSSPNPPHVSTAATYGVGHSKSATNHTKNTDSWHRLMGNYGYRGIADFRSFTRSHSAKDLARGLTKDEAMKARIILGEVNDWLDEFEQYLPTETKK